jgi:hypothetical protein
VLMLTVPNHHCGHRSTCRSRRRQRMHVVRPLLATSGQAGCPLLLCRHSTAADDDPIGQNGELQMTPFVQIASGILRRNSTKGKDLTAKLQTHVNSTFWIYLF